MSSRKRIPLGGWLLITLCAFGFFLYSFISSTYLLRQGVTTQGVVTDVGTVVCEGRNASSWQAFSVQFTDSTGQSDTGSISQCDYGGFNASPGDSVIIVYFPNDPGVIAPVDELNAKAGYYLIGTFFSGLITLILLPFWIRKRIRMASLQRQEEQAAAERWRAMGEHMAYPKGDSINWDSKL